MSEPMPGPGPHICLTFWGNLKHDARVIRTAAALVAAGARVTVVCTDTVGNLPIEEQHAEGFRVQRVRRPGPRRMRVVEGRPTIGWLGALWAALRGGLAHLKLAHAAFRTNADAYHAADIFPLLETWLVARVRRRPIVYEAYEISTDREGFQPIVGLIRVVERFLARRVDRMFATTKLRAEHFAQAYQITLPQVLQNRPPYRKAIDADLLRERCGISVGQPVVLYQGGLQPGRGLFNFLEAAQHVRGAVFVLLGSGALEQPLRQRIQALDLGDKVRMLAAVPAQDLHAWTCSADVGVQILENTCLNHYTTDSNKLFEYIMAELPVVASDFPEIRKVVAAYDVGVLVDPADAAQIRDALQSLVDDAAKRARYGANARAAAPELSWETQVPVLVETYRELCALPGVEQEIG